MRTLLILLLALCAGTAAAVPTMTVSAAPTNLGEVTISGQTGGIFPLGLIRFEATEISFPLPGFTITVSGTGWAGNLNPNGTVRVYCDDGDGIFDSNDTLLGTAQSNTPTITFVLWGGLTIPANSHQDLWIAVNLMPGAGANPAASFLARIADAAHVNSPGAPGPIVLGTEAPVTGTLRVIDFAVTALTPTSAQAGSAILIEGRGFSLPLSLTIGGEACKGNAVVNAEGTRITGLTVPPGFGSNLEVVLTTNGLPPQTLTQDFTYSAAPSYAGTNSATCSATGAGSVAVLILPLLALLRRRRFYTTVT